MKDVIKSILETKDDETVQLVENLLSEDLSSREREILEYCVKSYTDVGMMPTESALSTRFPEVSPMLANSNQLSYTDLEYHIKSLIRTRKSLKASQSIMSIASSIQEKGLKEEDIESLREFIDTENIEVSTESYDLSYIKEQYEIAKTLPTGLLTYVPEIDELIGGMHIGSVNTIMAYVSQFKSTWGLNIAYNNAYNMGYNIAILSFEVSKKDCQINLLCRHSADSKFSKFDFISHDKIRTGNMTDEEEDYLFNTVATDFMNNSKGKLFVLDETDFANMSYSEIRNTLYKIDDMCFEMTGTGLDAIIIDHAHLLKFTDNGGKGKSENAIINDYVSFFRRLSVKFRKAVNEQGESYYRQLCTVLLAQANRKGWEQATKKRGAYNMLAISESNEIERASYRVFSIWTDDLLKESKEAMVCVLKNRSGRTQYNPMPTYADGESYVFGESTFTDSNDSMEFNMDSLDSIFDDDSLGFLD